MKTEARQLKKYMIGFNLVLDAGGCTACGGFCRRGSRGRTEDRKGSGSRTYAAVDAQGRSNQKDRRAIRLCHRARRRGACRHRQQRFKGQRSFRSWRAIRAACKKVNAPNIRDATMLHELRA
jgi:hypothetical protein